MTGQMSFQTVGVTNSSSRSDTNIINMAVIDFYSVRLSVKEIYPTNLY